MLSTMITLRVVAFLSKLVRDNSSPGSLHATPSTDELDPSQPPGLERPGKSSGLVWSLAQLLEQGFPDLMKW